MLVQLSNFVYPKSGSFRSFDLSYNSDGTQGLPWMILVSKIKKVPQNLTKTGLEIFDLFPAENRIIEKINFVDFKETTIRSAKYLAFQIGTVQCRELKIKRLRCFFQNFFPFTGQKKMTFQILLEKFIFFHFIHLYRDSKKLKFGGWHWTG